MSNINKGQQYIGWKYQTPLQAEYLNTFLAGFSSPGLLTRPNITTSPLPAGINVTVHPFSLLVNPIYQTPEMEARYNTTDEGGNNISLALVKVSTTKDVSFVISKETVAIGFTYSFSDGESFSKEWYGDIQPLLPNQIQNFNGIIIATCQMFTFENNDYYSLSTSGADISDMLLLNEGWNPAKWLSVIHPKRVYDNKWYNKLEVRCHNKRFSGYVNGFGGLNKIREQDVVYELDSYVDPVTNPDGIRGFMPANYNAFKLQSDEFGLCVHGETLPLDKTPGSVFALVDASQFNPSSHSNPSLPNSFTNKLVISPVHMANTNSFFEGDTLYII